MPDVFSVTVPDEGLSLDDLEREFIYYTLHLFEGNKSQTCRALGVSQPRLRRMMDHLGIACPRNSQPRKVP